MAGRGLGRSRCCLFYLFVSVLLFSSSVVRAFLLLPSSRRGLRLSTRRFGLDKPASPLTPTASHSIVSGPSGLYCRKCGEMMDFKSNCAPAAAEKADEHAENEAKRAAAHAENEAKRAAAHAENEAQRNAMAKRDFWRNATAVLIGCLALAVVSFFSREVASWVKTTVVPLLNSTRERLIGLILSVVGYLASKISR